MKMKDMIDLYEDIQDKSFDNFMEDRVIDKIDSIGEYMNQMADSGKNIVIAKLDEHKFVQCLDIMRATLLSSMVIAGQGKILTIAEISGELKSYTDTIALTVLGMLADEKVI